MQKKNISGILTQLKKSDRFKERVLPGADDDSCIPTSFGIPLIRTSERSFSIDLTTIKTFSGISDLVYILMTSFYQQCESSATDVFVQQAVHEAISPELAGQGINYVSLHARRPVAATVQPYNAVMTHFLHQALSSLQSKTFRDGLFGSGEFAGQPVAWLFPLNAKEACLSLLFLLEYDPVYRFIRITIEPEADNRLFLKRIPHRIVDQLDYDQFMQDINKLTDTIVVGIHQASQNQREYYTEEPGRQPVIFELLARSELKKLSLIRFSWDNRNMKNFLLGKDNEVRKCIAKTLILLEDTTVLRQLSRMQCIELKTDNRSVFLNITRRGACLNIALDSEYSSVNLDQYLQRTPNLQHFTDTSGHVMENVRIVFIHHLTAETLGCIRAYQKMQCANLHGLFIRYKSITPDAYMDALLSLPEASYTFHSLYNLGDSEQLQGHFVLSWQFSPLHSLEPLPSCLRDKPHDYFSAMRKSACHIFFSQVVQAKKASQVVQLVEDGGYVAPLLNQWTQENKTVQQAFEYACMPANCVDNETMQQPLKDWLSGTFYASVEHTRNGYDQMRVVMKKYGKLDFSCYTMAVSDYKNIEEGRGAAMAILSACEMIMNGQGDSIYSRNAIIIGSRGNIGHFLLQYIADRTDVSRTIGVDIIAQNGQKGRLCDAIEFSSLKDMPRDTIQACDLIIGITGHPVLQPDILEEILLNGHKKRIYLVSGSTKNLEFAAVLEWLQKIRSAVKPTMGTEPVHIESLPIKDPLTEFIQGTCLRIHFTGPNTQKTDKDIMLLADGMPLNFNFYGVPSEIIDKVMMQLMQMCVLGVKQPLQEKPPAADLYVLDYTIDSEGNPLQGRELP